MMRSWLDSLDRISVALAKVPSMAYALSYLGAIPIFATLYCLLPHDFYHSTVQHESVLDEDAETILRHIREEVGAEFQKEHESPAKDVGLWNVNITAIRFHSLRPSGKKIGFDMTIPLRGIGENGGQEMITSVHVDFDLGISMATWAPGDSWKTVIKLPTFLGRETLPFDPHVLFPRRLRDSSLPRGADNRTVFIPISEPLNNELTGFANAVKGFPSKVSGSYARMFYFSAVTITTLGYGDIVPITNTARLLVATEAIAGVVLVGLFLNALFQGRKHSGGNEN
jgi:Ion channel